MAIHAYIKLDGIKGDTTALEHTDQLEVLSWSHGFNQPTSPVRSSAGSGTVEQAQHSSFSFTKYLDSATAQILERCWSGDQIKEAVVSCYRADGSKENKPLKYLEIKMEHVIISGYSIAGGAGDLPVENISLDYGILSYNYIPRKPDAGKPDGNKPAKHNLETRKVG